MDDYAKMTLDCIEQMELARRLQQDNISLQEELRRQVELRQELEREIEHLKQMRVDKLKLVAKTEGLSKIEASDLLPPAVRFTLRLTIEYPLKKQQRVIISQFQSMREDYIKGREHWVVCDLADTIFYKLKNENKDADQAGE